MAQAGLMGRLGVALALAAVGSACAAPSPPEREAARLVPFHAVPGSLLLPPALPAANVRDTCGASALAYLVGRRRTEIPVAVDLTRRRVSCTACPVAPEIRLDRVDILYDAQTNRVTKVTCG